MAQNRKAENILNAMCVMDKNLAFNCKFTHKIGRLCLSCIITTYPEAKEQWWNTGTHHYIKQETVLSKTKCIRCKIDLANIKPAIACTTCYQKIFNMDDDTEEAFNAGVLLNSEDQYPIVELKNITYENKRIRYKE